ncbi:MAG: ABC transporter permease subunit [Chitinivibrionales bacterium]|nr:ABC transporter permease subunit [Chitinivibrionales bacterium]
MATFKQMFTLRATLDKTSTLVIGLVGFVILFGLWIAVTSLNFIPQTLLPSPFKVLASFKELHFEDALVRNTLYSIKLNVLGYLEAVIIAIPLGFAIGLFPILRACFTKYIEALRFVPLAAATGLFIAWFGIDDSMKIQFLAVSIIVYLLPVVIQRIDDVDDVYVQTAHTLGANQWQKIVSVFAPAVMSRIIDDIRVLVAISWTYITIAEALNMTGGIGALAYQCARKSRIDKVFAVLVLIVLIGFVQDKVFKYIDKLLFPFKYLQEK